MAGSYADVPGRRMAYDRDGSEGVKINSSNVITGTYSGADMALLNDEATGGAGAQVPTEGKIAIIFPELRDIVGYFMASVFTAGYHFDLSTSADTTNGVDGTWTVRVATPTVYSPLSPSFRSNISTVSWTGVKAIRWRVAGGPDASIHLYGDPASGQNPDRLRWWQPVTDAVISGPYFDLGDVPRGNADVVQFRIKNNSSTLTANSIEISAEALTDTTPTNVGQHQFSDDGSTYTSTLNIGNLAPGALSSVLYMRRDTSASAILGLWVTRFVATAASWT